MSKSKSVYEANLSLFKDKYSQKHKEMYDHIYDNWINKDDHTCNWQSFCNKPGFANTNSPLESFNKTIKHQYTLKNILLLGIVIGKLETIILYYSNNKKIFETAPRFVKKTHQLALALTKKNFKVYSDQKAVIYKGVNHTCKINLNNKACYKNCSCNCKYFMKDGVCMHLVGYCWLYNRPFFSNYSNSPTEFAIQTKRGRHKKFKGFGQIQ